MQERRSDGSFGLYWSRDEGAGVGPELVFFRLEALSVVSGTALPSPCHAVSLEHGLSM